MPVPASKSSFHCLLGLTLALVFAHSNYAVFQFLPTDLRSNHFYYIIDNNLLE
jgi:hypothetical protein